MKLVWEIIWHALKIVFTDPYKEEEDWDFKINFQMSTSVDRRLREVGK